MDQIFIMKQKIKNDLLFWKQESNQFNWLNNSIQNKNFKSWIVSNSSKSGLQSQFSKFLKMPNKRDYKILIRKKKKVSKSKNRHKINKDVKNKNFLKSKKETICMKHKTKYLNRSYFQHNHSLKKTHSKDQCKSISKRVLNLMNNPQPKLLKSRTPPKSVSVLQKTNNKIVYDQFKFEKIKFGLIFLNRITKYKNKILKLKSWFILLQLKSTKKKKTNYPVWLNSTKFDNSSQIFKIHSENVFKYSEKYNSLEHSNKNINTLNITVTDKQNESIQLVKHKKHVSNQNDAAGMNKKNCKEISFGDKSSSKNEMNKNSIEDFYFLENKNDSLNKEDLDCQKQNSSKSPNDLDIKIKLNQLKHKLKLSLSDKISPQNKKIQKFKNKHFKK